MCTGAVCRALYEFTEYVALPGQTGNIFEVERLVTRAGRAMSAEGLFTLDNKPLIDGRPI